MKMQRTIQCLFCVALLIPLLCGTLQGQQAGPSFFEDFSDGDATDGKPVNWLPGPGAYNDPGFGYVLTPEGLEVAGGGAADAAGTPYTYRDVSARVQIKRISNHTRNWPSGLGLRWRKPDGTGGYWIDVQSPNSFCLGRASGLYLGKVTLPFNIDETELIIRADIVGRQIKCWCWPAGESMPEAPQITVMDDWTPDGHFALYAGTLGGKAIYRWVKVESLDVPIVDFNGDGTVEIDDLLRIIASWGRKDPVVDIVPDGIVDKKDLEVLMDHWQQDVNDPTLLAHWALDETEGVVAHDCAGTNDGTVIGLPVWQPTGGAVDGALEFDGMTSLVADSPLSPSDGPFSVLAWVQGGAPGQTVVSQAGGATWLMAGAAQGALLTHLSGGGRTGAGLPSEAIIADGDWHRIGFTWDGAARTLYVDEVLAAEDTQPGLAVCYGGVLIGCGSNRAPGTFWKGLIDDVRIYNRAVKP